MAVDRAVAEEGRSFWSAAILCRFGVWRARTRILRSWQKRQRTAALQDAGATQSAPCGVREVLECVWLATAFRPPDEATNLGAVRPLDLSPSRPLPAKAAAPLLLRRTHSKTLSRPSRPRAESARSWSACGLPPLFVRRTWQRTSDPFALSTVPRQSGSYALLRRAHSKTLSRPSRPRAESARSGRPSESRRPDRSRRLTPCSVRRRRSPGRRGRAGCRAAPRPCSGRRSRGPRARPSGARRGRSRASGGAGARTRWPSYRSG